MDVIQDQFAKAALTSNSSPRILILSGVQGDTRRYRAFHLWQQLNLAGVECVLSHITSPNLVKQAAGANIVILQRVSLDRYIETLLRLMRQQQTLILYDTDDLLFDLSAFQYIDSPDFADPIRTRLYLEEMRGQKRMLENSDAVLVSSEYLADRVRLLNKPVWIHRNAFSLEMESLSEKAEQGKTPSHGKLVIGYASGTPTHDRDLALISQALQQILRTHQDVELWLVGPIRLIDNWPVHPGQLRQIPLLPWRKLPSLLAQFDINLAPLMLNNPFSLSKSEIKYLEAGLVSVPTLASKTPAYEFAIRCGINGFLATSEEEWLSTLEHLIATSEIRQRAGQLARTQVLEQYNPRLRAQEFITKLNLISSELRGEVVWDPEQLARIDTERTQYQNKTERFWVPERLERQPSTIQRAVYQLRYRNLSSLAGYIWIYIRRRLAFIFPFRKPT